MATPNGLEVFEKSLTKTKIKSMAQQAIERVREDGNPLQVAEAISAMEHFIKEVKADESFKDYVREEVINNQKCFVSKSGAKIELAETGTKFDFSQCNDMVYIDLNIELDFLKIKIEERQKFLKALPESGIQKVEEDGEVVLLYPPSKSSVSSYKITLSR